MSNLIPEAMDRVQLATVLRDMADRVEAGDSFEGNLEYHMPIGDETMPTDWPTEDCEFWVHGVYRVGNLQGQGGMRMIGKVPGR